MYAGPSFAPETSLAIYFITKNDSYWDDDKKLNHPLLYSNNAFGTYIMDMSEISTWQGEVTDFRLDPIDEPDPLTCEAQIAINEISVTASRP